MLKEQESLKKLDKIKKNIHTNTKITKKDNSEMKFSLYLNIIES